MAKGNNLIEAGKFVYTENAHLNPKTGEIMIRLTQTSKLLFATVILAMCALAATGNPPLTPQGVNGKLLQVKGTVQVNGADAVSGAPIASDSGITTGKNSSAVVSLGKLGRVEVLPDTTMKLQFSDPGVTVGMLDAGRVRISSSALAITAMSLWWIRSAVIHLWRLRRAASSSAPALP